LKILPETLFRTSCGFQKAVYAQKKFLEAAFDAANIKILLTGFRGNFSICRRLPECTTRIRLFSSKQAEIYFLYKKAAKKFESVSAYVENADLIVEIFKNIHFMTKSL
jgi:hypothetical protein